MNKNFVLDFLYEDGKLNYRIRAEWRNEEMLPQH